MKISRFRVIQIFTFLFFYLLYGTKEENSVDTITSDRNFTMVRDNSIPIGLNYNQFMLKSFYRTHIQFEEIKGQGHIKQRSKRSQEEASRSNDDRPTVNMMLTSLKITQTTIKLLAVSNTNDDRCKYTLKYSDDDLERIEELAMSNSSSSENVSAIIEVFKLTPHKTYKFLLTSTCSSIHVVHKATTDCVTLSLSTVKATYTSITLSAKAENSNVKCIYHLDFTNDEKKSQSVQLALHQENEDNDSKMEHILHDLTPNKEYNFTLKSDCAKKSVIHKSKPVAINLGLIKKAETQTSITVTAQTSIVEKKCKYILEYTDDSNDQNVISLRFDKRSGENSAKKSQNISNLTPNKPYKFTFNSECAAKRIDLEITTSSIILRLSTKNKTHNSITLEAIAEESSEKCSYQLEYSDDIYDVQDISFILSAKQDSNNWIGEHTVTDLTPNIIYNFSLKSTCAQISAFLTAKTNSAILKLSHLSITHTSITLSIVAINSDNKCEYKLEYINDENLKQKTVLHLVQESSSSEWTVHEHLSNLIPKKLYHFVVTSLCLETSVKHLVSTEPIKLHISAKLSTHTSISLTASTEESNEKCVYVIFFTDDQNKSQETIISLKKEESSEKWTGEHIIYELTPNKIYRFFLKSSCADKVAFDDEKTGPVTLLLTAIEINQTSIELYAIAVNSDQNCFYLLEYTVDDNSHVQTPFELNKLSKSNDWSGVHIVSNLTPNQNYNFSMSSSCSESGATYMGTTVAANFTLFIKDKSETSITLVIKALISDEKCRYHFFYNNDENQKKTVTVQLQRNPSLNIWEKEYKIKDLTPNKWYHFRITSNCCNLIKEHDENTDSLVLKLSKKAVATTSITLSIVTVNSSTKCRYQLEFMNDNNETKVILLTLLEDLEAEEWKRDYHIKNLTPLKSYNFTLSSACARELSEYSVTTESVTLQLTATSSTLTTILLLATAINSDIKCIYRLEYMVDNNEKKQSILTLKKDPESNSWNGEYLVSELTPSKIYRFSLKSECSSKEFLLEKMTNAMSLNLASHSKGPTSVSLILTSHVWDQKCFYALHYTDDNNQSIIIKLSLVHDPAKNRYITVHDVTNLTPKKKYEFTVTSDCLTANSTISQETDAVLILLQVLKVFHSLVVISITSNDDCSKCIYYLIYKRLSDAELNLEFNLKFRIDRNDWYKEIELSNLVPNTQYSIIIKSTCIRVDVSSIINTEPIGMQLKKISSDTISINVGITFLISTDTRNCVFNLSNGNETKILKTLDNITAIPFLNLNTNADYNFRLTSDCSKITDELVISTKPLIVQLEAKNITPISAVIIMTPSSVSKQCSNELVLQVIRQEITFFENHAQNHTFKNLNKSTEYNVDFISNCIAEGIKSMVFKTALYDYKIVVEKATVASILYRITSLPANTTDCGVYLIHDSKSSEIIEVFDPTNALVEISGLHSDTQYTAFLKSKCGDDQIVIHKTVKLQHSVSMMDIGVEFAKIFFKSINHTGECVFTVSGLKPTKTSTDEGFILFFDNLSPASKYNYNVSSNCLEKQVYHSFITNFHNPSKIFIKKINDTSIKLEWSYIETNKSSDSLYTQTLSLKSDEVEIKSISMDLDGIMREITLINLMPQTKYLITICSVVDSRSNCSEIEYMIVVEVPDTMDELKFKEDSLTSDVVIDFPKITKFQGDIKFCLVLILGKIDTSIIDLTDVINIFRNGKIAGTEVIYSKNLTRDECMDLKNINLGPATTSIYSVHFYACIHDEFCTTTAGLNIFKIETNFKVLVLSFGITLFALLLFLIPTYLNVYHRENTSGLSSFQICRESLATIPYAHSVNDSKYLVALKSAQNKIDLLSDITDDILVAFIENVLKDSESLRKQFSRLPASDHSLCSVGRRDNNKALNRYRDILPSDSTRVRLVNKGSADSNDYINASYISGKRGKETYIATQAPMAETLSDFWLMIWEQNANTIVMLTKLKENRRSKCHQYWPESNYPLNCDFGLSILHCNEFQTSTIIVVDYSVQRKGYKETKMVRQFRYQDWSDHGVPSSLDSIYNLWKQVDDWNSSQPIDAPMIVHCSAGVGRAGTFITIDNFLQLIRSGTTPIINIPRFVAEMRCSRGAMVQTEEQYILVYKMLSHYLKYPNWMISINCIVNDINTSSAALYKEFLRYSLEMKHINTNHPQIYSTFTKRDACIISADTTMINMMDHLLNTPNRIMNFLHMSNKNSANPKSEFETIIKMCINQSRVDCQRQKLEISRFTQNIDVEIPESFFTFSMTLSHIQSFTHEYDMKFKLAYMTFDYDDNSDEIAKKVRNFSSFLESQTREKQTFLIQSSNYVNAIMFYGLLIVEEISKTHSDVHVGFIIDLIMTVDKKFFDEKRLKKFLNLSQEIIMYHRKSKV